MTIKEAFARVIRTEENRLNFNIEHLAHTLGVAYYGRTHQCDIKCYQLGMWRCIDSWVGATCYFLGDKPLALSCQSAREEKEELCFYSKEIVDEARTYITNLAIADGTLKLDFLDISEDIGEGYKLDYMSEVLDWSKATYKGEKIKLLEILKDDGEVSLITKTGKFELANGEIKILNIDDLLFSYEIY